LFFIVARKIRLLKGGQLNMIAKRVVDKLKPFINDNDEIDEEMKKIVAVKLGEKSNYNSDETGEEKLSDKEIILSNFIDTDQKKISQSSAEK
jgi:hypothetical protein